jgi:hypothetical protein
MKTAASLGSRTLVLAAAVALLAPFAVAGQMSGPDKRKETTIQTATLDVGGAKGAVEIRYLNVPWGEQTFSYIEQGSDEYYAARTWPFAHLKLATAAKLGGKDLAPGDYVLFVTPKSASAPMRLTLAAFKPGESGTFLVAGNVFTETPKDAVEVLTVPVTFTRGAPSIDHLEIVLAKAGAGVEIKVHYGDRWLSQTLETR